jgi:hypothetical protein
MLRKVLTFNSINGIMFFVLLRYDVSPMHLNTFVASVAIGNPGTIFARESPITTGKNPNYRRI